MKLLNLLILTIGMSSASYALQAEHIAWEKVPLNIELPIQQERLIQFPKPIKIIDQQMSPSLNVLKVKDSLYLKAKEPSQDSRMIVQLIPDGDVIILNLKADKQYTNTTPIEIVLDQAESAQTTTTNHYEYNAIQLTRFAIQALFSPERVLDMPQGVYRSPMQTHKTIPLFYGASIEAHPIASWRGGHLFVTAVTLTNLLSKPVELHFDDLMGHWQTASFYPTTVLPARQQHESSTVFLVSEAPFHEALTQHERFKR